MHHAPWTFVCVFANQETLANNLYGTPCTMHHGGSLTMKIIYDYSFFSLYNKCTMHHAPWTFVCVFANQETLATDLYGTCNTLHHAAISTMKFTFDEDFHWISHHYTLNAPCTMDIFDELTHV
jgi:hypothetical protein